MVLYQCVRCQRTSPRQEVFHKVKIRGQVRLYCPVCSARHHQRMERDSLIVMAVLPLLGLLLVAFVGDFAFFWLLVNLGFVLLLMVLLIVPHELAHALAARLLGLRVFTISIGSGKSLWTGTCRGVQLVWKFYPVGGLVSFASSSLRFLRTRHFLVVLAGPALHVALIAAILLTVPRSILYPVDSEPVDRVLDPFRILLPARLLLVTDFVLANGLMVFMNLWPRYFQRDGQRIKSDGLALLTTPLLSAAAVQELHALSFYLEGQHCIEQGRHEEAVQWYRHGLSLYPQDQLSHYGLGMAVFKAGRFAEARECWKGQLDRPDVLPGLRLILLDAIATVDFLLASPTLPTSPELPGKEDLLLEAATCSQQVLADAPWVPSFQGTRGCILVVRGEIGEGEKLLRETMQEESSRPNKAYCACYLALAEAKRGHGDECGRLLEMARKLDPSCLALPLVSTEAATLLQGKAV